MDLTVEARYDGTSFHPLSSVDLPTNATVRITIELLPEPKPRRKSFLDTAMSLNLDGPSDWSENVDKYLYGTDEHGPA